MSDIVTTTTTTEWHSAFDYDNVDWHYHMGNLFPDSISDYMVIRANNNLYAISYDNIRYTDTGIQLGNGYINAMYYSDTCSWRSPTGDNLLSYVFQDGVLPYESIEILAQNVSRSHDHYFTTDQFRSGSINAPTGSYFDSIYLSSPVTEIINLLPIVLPILILFIASRKAIAFLRRLLSSA